MSSGDRIRPRHAERGARPVVEEALLQRGIRHEPPEQVGDDPFAREHDRRELRRAVCCAWDHALVQVRVVLVGSIAKVVRNRDGAGEPVGLHRVVPQHLLALAEPQQETHLRGADRQEPRRELPAVAGELPFGACPHVAVAAERRGFRDRVRIVHAHHLDVLGKSLAERVDRIGADADGVHLVAAAFTRFSGQLPHDHVQQFVREDLVHGAEAAAERRAAMEVHPARVCLLHPVEIEPELGKAALAIGEQQIGRFRRTARHAAEERLLERVEAEQPAREAPRQHRDDALAGLVARENGQAVPGLAGWRENDEELRRCGEGLASEKGDERGKGERLQVHTDQDAAWHQDVPVARASPGGRRPALERCAACQLTAPEAAANVVPLRGAR